MKIIKKVSKVASKVERSKEEIKAELNNKAVVTQEKKDAREIFEALKLVDTIYDAQTVALYVSGYLTFEIQKKSSQYVVGDLPLVTSKEKNKKLKASVEALLETIKFKNATEVASLLKRMGDTIAQYGAAQYLKKPMSEFKVTDIISK